MTPSEREAAERVLGQCVRSACSGAYAREVSSYLRQALDLIDSDERLMERARALLDEADERMRKCFHCNQAELHSEDCEVRLVIDALRTRLGEESDDERE